MKVSEDRFPLLYLYLEDQESADDERNVRARTITRGAAQILGRWPNYLSLVSYVSLVSLLSLLVCFILTVLTLSLLAHSSGRSTSAVVKCNGDDAKELFRQANLDQLINADNATFIVDIVEAIDSGVVACSLESRLSRTTDPVYHVRLVRSSDSAARTSRVLRELQQRHSNYKPLTIRLKSFLRGTAFARVKHLRHDIDLAFLVKILISWNFGGLVMDPDLMTVGESGAESLGDGIVVGVSGDDAVLVSTRRPCHAFVFDVMRRLADGGNRTSPREIVEGVHSEFCPAGRDCKSVRVVSTPFVCELDARPSPEGCVFARSGENPARDAWTRVCPLTAFLSSSSRQSGSGSDGMSNSVTVT